MLNGVDVRFVSSKPPNLLETGLICDELGLRFFDYRTGKIFLVLRGVTVLVETWVQRFAKASDACMLSLSPCFESLAVAANGHHGFFEVLGELLQHLLSFLVGHPPSTPNLFLREP